MKQCFLSVYNSLNVGLRDAIDKRLLDCDKHYYVR